MSRGPRALVRALFFLSGASALIYEVVWMRSLQLTVGSTTLAVSAVLSGYMAGLALGAWLFGSLADRIASPLRLYATLEIGIGLYALAFPQLQAWLRPAYVALAPLAAGSSFALLCLRFALALALLAIPTTLMGGTLPVLARLVARSEASFGSELGALYAANLAGAVLGTLAAGFMLVRALGMQGAATVASTLNLAIGVAALLWASALREGPRAPEPVAALPGPAVRPGLRHLLWAVVFLSGFVAMGYEVLWTRILIFSFNSTVFAFTVILATFLAGLGLGSVLFAALDRRYDRIALLAMAQVLAGVAALALAPLTTRAPDLLQALADSWGYTGGMQVAGMALASGLVILVPASLMGVVFPLGSRTLAHVSQAGREIGAAALVNTLGAALGSLATALVLIPALGLKSSLVALAALQVAAGWALMPWCPRGRRSATVWVQATAMTLALLAACTVLRGPSPFDRLHGGVVESHRDGAAASVTVVRQADGRALLRIDGFEAAGEGSDYGYMAMMAHLPLLLHAEPRRLLVICFGTGTTAGTGLLYPDVRVDVVDLNPAVFAFAGAFLGRNHGVGQDPRARLIVDDGRNYLLTARQRYDVITSEPMPPTFAGVSNLYSREYYALARERLNPGGLLAQWLPFHLVSLGQGLAILKTVQEVFPETALFVDHDTGIVVARREGRIELDAPRLRMRLADARLGPELRLLGVSDISSLASRFRLAPASTRLATARAALVTDDRPSLEFDPPSHRTVVRMGGYRPDEASALELVYRVGARDELPLVNATPKESAAASAVRSSDAHAYLGDLYSALGRRVEARAEYQAGAAGGAGPLRARFLYALARSGMDEGRPEAESRALLEELLALEPGNAEAQALLGRVAR